MGTLPADSEQYMLIEDIYGSVEIIEKQLDSMMDNKIARSDGTKGCK